MQMAQKGKIGRTFAFGQELWYTRKKKRGRICMEIRKGTLKDLELSLIHISEPTRPY